MTDQVKLTSIRARLLAKVFLTQQLAVVTEVHDVDGLDFLVYLSPEDREKPSPIPAFGVFVRGTARPISTSTAANNHLIAYWEKSKKNRFVMPFMGLLFSMEGDTGYWSWLYEPIIHKRSSFPGLKTLEHPDFKLIEPQTAKNIMKMIVEWYSVLDEIVFAGY